MKISTGTIVRTIIGAIAVINILLQALGFTEFSIDENTLYTVVSGIYELLTIAVVFWKDNNFTSKRLALEEIKKLMNEKGVKGALSLFGDLGAAIAEMYDERKEKSHE